MICYIGLRSSGTYPTSVFVIETIFKHKVKVQQIILIAHEGFSMTVMDLDEMCDLHQRKWGKTFPLRHFYK